MVFWSALKQFNPAKFFLQKSCSEELHKIPRNTIVSSQETNTSSGLTIETLDEKGVKYAQY